MKILKFTKVLTVLTAISIFLAAGLLAGIRLEQNRLKKEEQLETVEKIAVVNLDEGIYTSEGKINYAAQLMQFPGDNFVSEGLKAARTGIYDGSYGAYVIIPASFSANTESINLQPQKSVIEYAINPNLKGETSNRVITGLKSFESTIRENMSYMYVDAILSEFHQVQDSAKVIMLNGNKDLQALLSINPADLIEFMEITEMQTVKNEIEDIDLGNVYSDNQKVMEQADTTFTESITKGKDEFEKVSSKSEIVAAASDSLTEEAGAVDLLYGDNGMPVYAGGLREIENYVALYNVQIAKEKTVLKQQLGWTGDMIRTMDESPVVSNVIQKQVDERLENIGKVVEKGNEEHNKELNSSKEIIKAGMDEVSAKIEEASKKDVTISGNVPGGGTVSGNVPGGGTVSGNVPGGGTVSGNVPGGGEHVPLMDYEEVLLIIKNIMGLLVEIPESQITIANETINIKSITKDIFEGLTERIDSIEEVSKKQIDKILETGVVDEVQKKSETEMGKITNSIGKLTEEMQVFMGTMEEFDPFLYYDEGMMNDSLMKISDNLFKIESETNDKNMDYRDFINSVYENAEINTMTLEDDINEAYQGTSDKVMESMESVKQDRGKLNSQNNEMLSDFSNKLPYTRLGNVEYTQAYDFIVSPVNSEDKSVIKKRIFNFSDYDSLKMLFIILILIFIVEGGALIAGKLKQESDYS